MKSEVECVESVGLVESTSFCADRWSLCISLCSVVSISMYVLQRCVVACAGARENKVSERERERIERKRIRAMVCCSSLRNRDGGGKKLIILFSRFPTHMAHLSGHESVPRPSHLLRHKQKRFRTKSTCGSQSCFSGGGMEDRGRHI